MISSVSNLISVTWLVDSTEIFVFVQIDAAR